VAAVDTEAASDADMAAEAEAGAEAGAEAVMDMLLAKKRAADRRHWLETEGDLAEWG
jgi:topoisomerase-4 subunit B